MRLANAIKTTKITIAGEVIALKPSLRAAYLLSVREGGFEALLKQLSENSISAMHDVIKAASGDEAARSFMNAVSAVPLSRVLFDADEAFGLEPAKPLNEQLIAYLLALLDLRFDENRTAPQTATAKHETDFAKLLESLFEVATGWLGWSADQAWAAAPAEIISAHRGRVTLLKSIFGGKNQDENEPKAPDFTRDHDANATLRMLKASGF